MKYKKTYIKICLSFLVALAYTPIFSQSEVKFYYNETWELTDSVNAFYYRILEINENNLKFDGPFSDYNNLGHLLTKGIYSNGNKQGSFEFFYPNGQIESSGSYSANFRFGKWKYYYENGQLKQIVTFRAGNQDLIFKYNFSVLEYYKPDGAQLLSNGTGNWEYQYLANGFLHYYEGDLNSSFVDKDRLVSKKVIDKVIITGEFYNGLKDGDWSIRFSHSKYFNTDEKFEQDTFISGLKRLQDYGGGRNEWLKRESIEKFPDFHKKRFSITEGQKIDKKVFADSIFNYDISQILTSLTGKTFSVKNRSAGFGEGDYELSEQISKLIKYPFKSKEEGVEGTIYLNLLVDKTGIIKEIQKMNSLNEELDKEALRVMNTFKEGWLPALRDGKACPSYALIPITFEID